MEYHNTVHVLKMDLKITEYKRKNDTMKKGLLFTVALFMLAIAGHAQNDTMYFLKNGSIVNKQSIKFADVDSAIFYKPLTTPENVFMDTRDSNIYLTVNIGGHVWMAENLRYLPAVMTPDNGSIAEASYYVYDYDGTDVNQAKQAAYYKSFGVLYNYPAAISACPADWHLPTSNEWNELIEFVGADAGNKLKSNTIMYWAIPNNGTNEYGFNALGAGSRQASTGSFLDKAKKTGWWISAFMATTSPSVLELNSSASPNKPSYKKDYGFSVRCVQD